MSARGVSDEFVRARCERFCRTAFLSSTLFRGMATGTEHPVFHEVFKNIGRDESRHLQICMTLLEND